MSATTYQPRHYDTAASRDARFAVDHARALRVVVKSARPLIAAAGLVIWLTTGRKS